MKAAVGFERTDCCRHIKEIAKLVMLLLNQIFLVYFLLHGIFPGARLSDVTDANEEIEEIETIKQGDLGKNDDIRCVILEPKAALCDEEVGPNNTVEDGTVCIFRDSAKKEASHRVCTEGQWIDNPVERDIYLVREKRTHTECSTYRSRRRRWWRRRRRLTTTCETPNHCPYFSTCPSTLTFTTPSGSTSVRVTWTVPIAVDVEDGYLPVTQTHGPIQGELLPGSPGGEIYPVSYYAKDSSGCSESCRISLIVKVVYCPRPSYPVNGQLYCGNCFNYGQSCTVTCNTGFSSKASIITCQQNGQWTSTPECVVTTCPNTRPSISNGHYSLCTRNLFGSVCYPTCDAGYTASPNPVKCQSDGTWTSPVEPVCIDTDPPVITNCPSNIVKQADIGKTSAVVTWQIPTATDNQDTSGPEVKQTAGKITPNSRIEGGVVHTIKYVAFDLAGNPSAECSFTVEVRVTCCPTLSCPTKSHYSCDNKVIYGSQCTFNCAAGYLLEGSNVMTCQADGTWSSPAPVCNVITCSPPEDNGLTFDNGYYECPAPVTYQSTCKSVCNPGFQLDGYSTISCTLSNDNQPVYVVGGTPNCRDTEPPVFPNCTSTKAINLVAIKGTRSAVVQYSIPEATDNTDSSPQVEKISGPNIGDTVEEDDIAYVEFRATDSAGNPSVRCIYALQVQVIECDVYVPPSNGAVTCTLDNVYGSACNLSCNEGYVSTGADSTECLQSGQWSSDDLACEVKLCPAAPVDPSNGYYACPEQSYPYNTICYAGCNDGFTLQQSSFARCSANQTWESSSPAVCIDTEAPVFTECRTEITLQADSRSTTTLATWDVPTATDNVDVSPTVVKLSGPDPDTEIEGEVTVKYQATDEAGNPSDICTMDITVDVIQCPSPRWPDFGDVSCDLGNIYGSNCSFTCKEGYTISEPSHAQCREDKTWSYMDEPPYCSEISCGRPEDPVNGSYLCFDVTYSYQSVCVLECISGFSTDHTAYISCQADGMWYSPSSSTCKDSTPPTLVNCKSYQTFYADRGMDTASASWIVPTATDNVDLPGDIVVEQVSGPSLGSALPVGATVVEYRATDTAGNPSVTTCSITLNVEVIYCNHPKYSFDDPNMMYTCSSLQFGDSCTLDCPAAKPFSLVGPNAITCEATFSGGVPSTFWSYEGNSQPFCEAEVCPMNLKSPKNGYLSYTNVAQPVAFVYCNENYDLEYEFDKAVYCLDDGQWKPDTIPDCTYERRPSLTILDAEFTYSGECGSESAVKKIKESVLQRLQSFIGTAYAPGCFADSSCGYDDVICTCGDYSSDESNDRKRRQADSGVTNITVSLVLTANREVASFADVDASDVLLSSVSDSLETAIKAGEFDIDGLEIDVDSYSRGEYSFTKCNGTGMIRVGLKCKSCASGNYLGEVNDTKKCTECPIGTYMDHDSASSCYPCPEGTSTNTTGSKSADMCVDFCPLGQVSPTRVRPCTPCVKGQYQNTVGGTACQTCDVGQTTFQNGASNCSYYDIVFRGHRSFPIFTTETDWNEASVSFWIFMQKESNFSIYFGQMLDISIRKGFNESEIIISNTSSPLPWSVKWTHVVVTLSMLTTSYSVYINGDAMESDASLSGNLIPSGTAVNVSHESDNDIRISSLLLKNAVISLSEVSTLSSSCLTDTLATAEFSSDHLIESFPDTETDPSTCIATDSCDNDPCGNNLCTPTMSGYICTCFGGFSGTNCETPPDNCYDHQCQHGATCVSNESNYTCSCVPGYTGTFCQNSPVDGGWGTWTTWSSCSASCDGGVKQRSRECDNPTPSEFGQECVGSSVEVSSCSNISCATLNPCESRPCGYHLCTPTADGFSCTCNKGYTGNNCSSLINNCNPDPCQNGGTCVNEVGNFTCTCPDKYTGDICEKGSDEICYYTVWSSCSATCGGGTSTRNKLCLAGLTLSSITPESKSCNNNPCTADACLSSPCTINSTCITDGDNFTCLCETGKTGTMCDTVIDFCIYHLCEHGTCSNTGSGYQCLCDEGYSGVLCNVQSVDGGWGEWSEWSNCSSDCGEGTRNRTRLCDNPAPSIDGKTCEGASDEAATCQQDCNDACASNPCGSDHDCINEDDGYMCVCHDGFSGEDCAIPPDYCTPSPCLNSGQCVSSVEGFNCSCTEGYDGETCDIEPDESVWEAWSGWSDCSATCDGGLQTRQRDCRIGSEGRNCSGSREETATCREDECPACEELQRFYGTTKSCETEDEMITCRVSCVEGYLPTNSSRIGTSWSLTYQCGPNSSYKWNFTEETPSCSMAVKPHVFAAEATLTFTPPVPCGLSSNLESGMATQMSAVACQTGTPCQIQASVEGCSSRKRRETIGDQGQITFTFTFDLTDVPETVTDYWSLANISLSKVITNGNDWLAVNLNGTLFIADTSNFTDDGQAECSEGYFLQEGYAACVGCSPGTWYDREAGYCFFCPVGTYQDLAAQYSCKSCPEGYTTVITGSYDRDDCKYKTSGNESNKTNGIIIGVSVSAAVIVIAIVGVVIYRCGKADPKIGASCDNLQTASGLINSKFYSRTSDIPRQIFGNPPKIPGTCTSTPDDIPELCSHRADTSMKPGFSLSRVKTSESIISSSAVPLAFISPSEVNDDDIESICA